MRFSRTAWLVLGVGFFVIVFATLFMVYARQSSEQEGLEKSLAEAQTQLTKLLSGREALESQLSEQQNKLAAAQSLLDRSKASFPHYPTGIEYDEVLSEIAEDYELEVVHMVAGKPYEKKVGDVIFFCISFEVGVRGDVNSILSMVGEVANDKRFVSATIEGVNIIVPSTCAAEAEEPSGTIKLVGYSYGGK